MWKGLQPSCTTKARITTVNISANAVCMATRRRSCSKDTNPNALGTWKGPLGPKRVKTGEIQGPPQADETAVRGLRRLRIFDKEDSRLRERRLGNDHRGPQALRFFIRNREKRWSDSRTVLVPRRRRGVQDFSEPSLCTTERWWGPSWSPKSRSWWHRKTGFDTTARPNATTATKAW